MQQKDRVAVLAAALVIGTTTILPQTAAKTSAPYESVRASEVVAIEVAATPESSFTVRPVEKDGKRVFVSTIN
jgi:hypothetical protein